VPTGSVLATLGDGSARTLRLGQRTLEETASYATAPWFAESVRIGKLLVSVGAGRRELELRRAGASAMI